MNANLIYLDKYKGLFHWQNGSLYEFLCETKDGYFEYILLID